jgi:hypothetical protein
MKLKVKRVSHSFWLNLATKARASFKIDQPLINEIVASDPTWTISRSISTSHVGIKFIIATEENNNFPPQ